MSVSVDSLFAALWQDYIAITPSAENIHQLLKQQDGSEEIINDHIALRTFNLDKIRLDKLGAHFLALGYEEKGQYDFEQKKLKAKHFEHPDDTKPKVFISELLVEEFSPEVQAIIHKMVDQIDAAKVADASFLYSGTHWQVSQSEYQTLLAVSEYAAWMSVWGFRANHFTVSVNHLHKIHQLSDVNELLKQAGFVLNASGGEIKGGEDVCLAQSSTMADKIDVSFTDGRLTVPSCFYEFAQRYPMADGKLYQGFVAASADKIFESTNVAPAM